jgi:hypothetical protein
VAISHARNPREGSEAAQLATAFEDKFRQNFLPSLQFRTPVEITSLFGGLDRVVEIHATPTTLGGELPFSYTDE